jgi:hypothetical protein
VTDRAFPFAFVMFAAFASVLVWVFALMQHLPIR